MSSPFDVVIVGGGPAGCATALALLRRGARVAVIERLAAPMARLGESLLGVAGEALRELGVWEEFLRLEQRPSYYHRAAWGGRVEHRYALMQRYGPDRHLDRACFDALLLRAAEARGATVLTSATVRRSAWESGCVRLAVAQGGELRELVARRLVDAGGRPAVLSRREGATRVEVDRLLAVARTFARGGREPSTLVETTDHGWWYSAPQPGGRLVAAFFTDATSRGRHAGQDAVWSECLEPADLTRERLAGAEPLGPARTYFASPALLDWDSRLPLVPVGDAALCFDPIAAVGLCFALRSGLDAAEALLAGPRAASLYRSGIQRAFAEHLARRESLYASERRLRTTPFWQACRGRAHRRVREDFTRPAGSQAART